MSKALKVVGKIASVAAIVLAFVPGGAPFAAAASAISGVANGAAALLHVPDPQGGEVNKVIIDVSAPTPYVIGRTRTGGALVHDVGYGSRYKKIYNPNRSMVFVYSDCGPVEEIEGLYADGAFMTTAGAVSGYYSGNMHYSRQVGSSPTATALTGDQGTIPRWSGAHRLSGKAAGLVTLRWDKDLKKFAAGAPEFSALLKGVRVYSARDDSTYPGGSGPCRLGDESTYIYSENPSDHAVTYLFGRYENGFKTFGVGKSRDSIDLPAFVEWANVCDANNWKIGGVIYEPADKWNNLKNIMQAGSARPVHNNGALSVYFDAPRVALATFTEDDLANGDATIPATKSYRNRINGIVPRYRSPAHNWEYVPGSAVTVDEFIAVDGEEKRLERQYTLVQNGNHAAQLAAYEIVNAREIDGVTLSFKPKILPYGTGEAIDLDMPNLGLVGTFVIRSRRFDPLTAITETTLQSETPSKHAFALGATTTPPTPPQLLFAEDADEAQWSAAGGDQILNNLISGSWTQDLILSAQANGATVDIIISDHRRHYPEETVDVVGETMTGLNYGTTYYVYYDDEGRDGGAVTYFVSDSPFSSQTTDVQEYRHFVGYISSPSDAGAPASFGFGAAPPNVVPATVPNAAAINHVPASRILEDILQATNATDILAAAQSDLQDAIDSANDARLAADGALQSAIDGLDLQLDENGNRIGIVENSVADNASRVSIVETRANDLAAGVVPPGIPFGTVGYIDLLLNSNDGVSVDQPGELYIRSGYFEHPITEETVSIGADGIFLPDTAVPPDGKFYLFYSEQAIQDRFPGSNLAVGHVGTLVNDAGTWFFVDNSNTLFPYVLSETDLLLGVVYKPSADPTLTEYRPLLVNASATASRVASVENTTQDNASRISAVETENGTQSSRITTVEGASIDLAERLTSVETDTGILNNRVSSTEATTGENATRLTEVETSASALLSRALPPGLSASLSGSLRFIRNSFNAFTQDSNLGEIQWTAGYVDHPILGRVNIPSSAVFTPYDGGFTPPNNVFYLMFTEERAGVRFPDGAMSNAHIVPIVYNGAYFAIDDDNNFFPFTPLETDALLLIAQVDNSAPGIQSIVSLLNFTGEISSSISSLETTTLDQATLISAIQTLANGNSTTITNLQQTSGNQATALQDLALRTSTTEGNITSLQVVSDNNSSRVGTVETSIDIDVPPGIEVGLPSTVRLLSNFLTPSAPNDGEIWVSAGTFFHPTVGAISLPGGRLLTAMEGAQAAPGDTRFYIMFSQADVTTRFQNIATTNHRHVLAVRHDGAQWLALHNTTREGVPFTPADTDRIIAICTKTTATTGITTLIPLFNYNGETLFGSVMEAASTGFVADQLLSSNHLVRVGLNGRASTLVQRATTDGSIVTTSLEFDGDVMRHAIDGSVIWQSTAGGMEFRTPQRNVGPVLANGSRYMEVRGPGNFGDTYISNGGGSALGDLIWWYGPYAASNDACRIDNCIRAMGIDGEWYEGGSPAPGAPITNSGSNSSVAGPVISASTGPTVSAGNPASITFGYSFSSGGTSQTNSLPPTWTPTAQIRLYRSVNGGAFTLLETRNISGTGLSFSEPGFYGFTEHLGGTFNASPPAIAAGSTYNYRVDLAARSVLTPGNSASLSVSSFEASL